jgi:hypothetical protein
VGFPHLVKRFFGSLMARPLSPADADWVALQLLPGEQLLWARMSVADKSHAHGVARRVVSALGERATRPVVAAALLHDIGKVESRLGTFGRSLATVMAAVGLRTAAVRQYRAHNVIGRDLLVIAGSDPFTSQWAYEHETPRSEWTLPLNVADVLYAADDD